MKKKVFITGAGQGLGKELAKKFDCQNVELFLFGREYKKLEDVKNSLGVATANLVVCSLEDEDRLYSELDGVKSSGEEELILINNAATWTGGKMVKDITPKDFREAFELNFMSAFNMIHFILSLRSEGQLTRILNVGATASVRGGRTTSSFAVAKSSLRILTQSLAREMSENNLHACHVIVDGLIDNKRTRALNPKLEGERFISMDSLAKTILFIVSQPKDCWSLELDVRPYMETF